MKSRVCCWQRVLIGHTARSPNSCPCGWRRTTVGKRKSYTPVNHLTYVALNGKVILVKKPERKGTSASPMALMPDTDFARSYPQLTDYLCSTRWEDGSVRQTSTLSIFCEDGALKLSINDRALQQTLYVASETLDGALSLAETALQADNPHWRAWKGKK